MIFCLASRWNVEKLNFQGFEPYFLKKLLCTYEGSLAQDSNILLQRYKLQCKSNTTEVPLLYKINKLCNIQLIQVVNFYISCVHGLRTPREDIAFTARPKIQSQSQIFGTHVLQWTRRDRYDTLDLEAMILQEIYLFLGPLKYTSFLKVTFLKLMQNHGPSNEKLLGLQAKKFLFVGP